MSAYIIVGGGKVGTELAKLLLAEGKDIVIIEKDPDIAKELSQNIDGLIVCGDATNIDTLKDAKIENTDGIAIMSDNDNVNYMVAQFAKKFGVKNIVVRVNDPAKRELLISLGITAAISSTSVIATNVKNALLQGTNKTIMSLGGGKAELMEIPIPDELDGKKILELGMPEDARVVCLYRDGDVVIAHGRIELKKGDIAVVITKSNVAKQFLENFTQSTIQNI